MSPRALALLLLALAGAGCDAHPAAPTREATPPPPAPASVTVAPPVTSAAEPAPSPPPSASSAAVPAPPPPASCTPAAKPKNGGVVPDDQIADPSPAEPSPSALARAATCLTALGSDESQDLAGEKGCNWDSPQLLAFDPAKGSLALLFAPELPTAGGDCPALGALTLDASGAKTTRSTWKLSPTCNGRGLAVSRVVDGLRREGFTSEIRSLITARAVLPAGATGYRPNAFLDAPLCGWMLHVVPDRGRFSVRLVTPGNDAFTELGTFPIEKQRCVAFDHGRCATPTDFQYPSVEEVALSPDRKQLVVLVAATPGGHNEPLRYHVSRYAIPASARLPP